jgi:plasmid stabilization system protein ParE
VKIIWSTPAHIELQNAIADAEEIDPAWADAILTEIERVQGLLARHPRAGPAIDNSDKRKLRLGGLPLVLIYRLIGSDIEIGRLHHIKADWRP